MAARMALLHDLLHDPTVPITTLDILSGREPDTDRTVGLRLVRPPGDDRSPSAPPNPDGEELGIEPRMRARRIAVRRAHGRRRFRRLVAVGGVIAALVLAWVVTRTPLLDVDRVAVVGAERTSVAEVLEAAGIRSGQALLDVDLDAAATRVDELPWVASVETARHWPGTVVVRIQERQPVAVAPVDEGEWAVLSADGRVMDVVAEAPAGLVPLVDVPPVTQDGPLERATVETLAVARLLPPSLVAHVVGVAPVGEGQVELRLDPSGVVRLGPPSDLVDKLIAADAVLAQAPAHCVDVIDVQVADSPVLTLRPECG